jgi:multicomponent Na+:H+ antiporter subunit C
METIMAFTIGLMAAASVYLLLSQNLVRALFGLILLSNAANFVIFVGSGMTEGLAPLIPEGETTLQEPYANPLPQALILTAIVISFGLLAFALALVYRGNRELGTVDSDRMRVAEPPHPDQELPAPQERLATDEIPRAPRPVPAEEPVEGTRP